MSKGDDVTFVWSCFPPLFPWKIKNATTFQLDMTCMPHVWWMCCHFSTFTRCRTDLSWGTFLFFTNLASFTQPSIFTIFSSSHGVFYFVNQPTTHFVHEVAVSCNLCFLKWTCSVFFLDGSAEPLLEFSQHASMLSGNSNILSAKISLSCQGLSISRRKCMEFWVFVLV